jgi:hypothetical protein
MVVGGMVISACVPSKSSRVTDAEAYTPIITHYILYIITFKPVCQGFAMVNLYISLKFIKIINNDMLCQTA